MMPLPCMNAWELLLKNPSKKTLGDVDAGLLKKVNVGYGSYEWQIVVGPFFVLMGFFYSYLPLATDGYATWSVFYFCRLGQLRDS
jgi:hypothetical protein